MRGVRQRAPGHLYGPSPLRTEHSALDRSHQFQADQGGPDQEGKIQRRQRHEAQHSGQHHQGGGQLQGVTGPRFQRGRCRSRKSPVSGSPATRRTSQYKARLCGHQSGLTARQELPELRHVGSRRLSIRGQTPTGTLAQTSAKSWANCRKVIGARPSSRLVSSVRCPALPSAATAYSAVITST